MLRPRLINPHRAAAEKKTLAQNESETFQDLLWGVPNTRKEAASANMEKMALNGVWLRAPAWSTVLVLLMQMHAAAAATSTPERLSEPSLYGWNVRLPTAHLSSQRMVRVQKVASYPGLNKDAFPAPVGVLTFTCQPVCVHGTCTHNTTMNATFCQCSSGFGGAACNAQQNTDNGDSCAECDIDQLLQLVFTVLLLALASVQLWSERAIRANPYVEGAGLSKLKYAFHRLTFASSVLMVTVAIDPYGRRDLLPRKLVLLFSQNISILIVALCAVWIFLTIDKVYNTITIQASGPPRLIRRLLKFIVGVSFLITNVVTIIDWTLGDDGNTISGIFLVWMSLCILSLLILLQAAVYLLRARFDSFKRLLHLQPDQALYVHYAAIRKGMKRLFYIHLGGTLFSVPVMIAMFFTGLQRLNNERDSILHADTAEDQKDYSWQNDLFFWFEYVVLLLAVRLAWIRVKLCPSQQQSGVSDYNGYIELDDHGPPTLLNTDSITTRDNQRRPQHVSTDQYLEGNIGSSSPRMAMGSVSMHEGESVSRLLSNSAIAPQFLSSYASPPDATTIIDESELAYSSGYGTQTSSAETHNTAYTDSNAARSDSDASREQYRHHHNQSAMWGGAQPDFILEMDV